MRPLQSALTLAVLALWSCERAHQKASPGPGGAGADAPRQPSAAPLAPLPSAERAPSRDERLAERERLVLSLRAEGIANEEVLRALRRVPRHRFVPASVAGAAYADRPLSIGWGQTISQPYIVARMSEVAAPRATDRCLEIGTGSGYQAAVLSELCGETYSIEYLPELAAFAARNLHGLGYSVKLRQGDGYRGWPEAAPFDVILVTAAPERVPQPLLEQLNVGGRLVIPVGRQDEVQTLELWTRTAVGSGESSFMRKPLADVRFVPFLGGAGR